MKFLLYVLIIVTGIVLILLIIGSFLPKERIESRQYIFKATPEIIYTTITDNKNWNYRSDLKNLEIIEINGNIEIWNEISKDGTIIQFKTREKKPYSFYSFDMKSKIMTGYWTAELDSIDNGETILTITEYVLIKNPFIKVLSYLFFDIGQYMELYQKDLKIRLEDKI